MSADPQPTNSPELTICHLVQDVSYGGVESLLAGLTRETDAALDHHICYFSDRDEGAERLRDAGAVVTKLDIPADSPRSCFDPRSYRPIVQYLEAQDVDVIHAHYPLYVHILGRVAATLADTDRAVGSYHNPRSDFHPVMQALELATRPTMTATVGVSGEVERSFSVPGQQALPGFSHAGPVFNGIRVEAFETRVETADGQGVRETHDIAEDALVALSVGRYDQQKRQTDLIEAVDVLRARSRDVHLLLVGHGPLESTLVGAVEERGLEDAVTVTGRVESVPQYYAAGDVFVSASAYEGFGIVFAEAMAARLPIVATAVSGTEEVVADGETGILVPPAEPRALAAAIWDFESASRRTRFGDRGFERAAAEFDMASVAQSYLDLYSGTR